MLRFLAYSSWILFASTSALAQDSNTAMETGGGNCRTILESTISHYQELGKLLPTSFKFNQQLPTHQVLQLGSDACAASSAIELFQKVVTIHTQKIGLLLPFSRWSPSMQRSIMGQIKSLVKAKGLDPEKSLVWYDTNGQVDTMKRQLAQLVFSQHASVLIGGLSMAEAPVLAKMGDQLKIPTIILNRKFDSQKYRYVFHMGPDLKQMADTLLKSAESRGLSRVAVIMPQSSRDGSFVDLFTAKAEHHGISITGPLLYNPNDFGSIDTLFRGLFQLNAEHRKQEMLDLMTELKQRAKDEGVAFDPRTLMLPPELSIDAILIADHFKNVRHLAKALAFYGVKKLPLLGIPKWRAPELVDQKDENLDGSVLVDYVGSYKKLPYGISTETLADENLIEGSMASAVDLQMIISHAVAAGLQTLSGPRTARFFLYKKMEMAQNEDASFFQAPKIFRPNHEANWPSFLFSVTEGRLSLNRTSKASN